MDSIQIAGKLYCDLQKHYRNEEYPAVLAQAEAWKKDRFLSGVRVLDATPVFRNTCAKYMALLCAGAELTVAYSDRFPYSPAIVAYLNSLGIHTIENQFEGEYDLVLDCAACYRKCRSTYGYVELTRSGVLYYADCKKPVFLADSSRIKKIETCLGTGESCLRALAHLGYRDLHGKKVVLFGCGKVGHGIAMYLKEAGAEMIVVDDPTKCEVTSDMVLVDCRRPDLVIPHLSDAWAVVTATAHPGAAAPYASQWNRSNALLINMGVEDEFGPDVPESRVLNGKHPLNFILEEPTRMKYLDPTMALHNQGAKILLSGGVPNGPFEPDPGVENAILETVMAANVITNEIQRGGI